jgi:hypothetical protein
MKKTFLLFMSACFVVTASCATQPKLRFYKLGSDYSTNDTKDKFTFKMPSPVIGITVQKNEHEKPGWKPVFTSAVTSRKEMYAIKSGDPWYVDTKYTIAYQQNSFLLKSLGVELTDNRVKYTQVLGSIAATIIPLAFAVGPPPTKPPDDELDKLLPNLPYNVNVADCFGSTLDLDTQDAADKQVSCKKAINDEKGQDTGWEVIIVTERNNKNSTVSYDNFFTTDGYVSSEFPVPDCKEGFVFLEYKNSGRPYFSSITFANPTRLTTVPIPAKGSITYHPICSADTAYGPADVANPLELLKTTIDQVAAAKKAYDGAKKKK